MKYYVNSDVDFDINLIIKLDNIQMKIMKEITIKF